MSIKSYLISIFLLITSAAYAQFSTEQKAQLDSLNTIIGNSKSHDTSLAQAYVSISEILAISNPDTVIPLSIQAKAIVEKKLQASSSASEKKSYLKVLAGAFHNIGFTYYNRGEIQKSLEQFKKSIKLREEIGDKQGLATSLNNVGYIHKNRGDIQKALEYFHRSLKIYEEIEDKHGISGAITNIGTVYKIQGNIQKALENYLKSLKIEEDIGNEEGIAYSLKNVGAMHQKLGSLSRQKCNCEDDGGNLQKSLDNYHQSIKVEKKIGNKAGIASSLNSIGLIYEDRAEQLIKFQPKAIGIDSFIHLALDQYQNSLRLYEETGSKQGIAISLRNIASIYIMKGNITAAKKFATRSMRLAKELGFPNTIKETAYLLTIIHKKQGNWADALNNHELYIEMRDSISNEETQKAAIKQELQYAYEKKAQADSIKAAEAWKVTDAQLAAQDAQLEQEQMQRYALYGGLSLLFLFGGFMYNRFRVTHNQKGIIEKQKQVVEIKKKEADMQKEIVEERNKEIIDSITYARRLQEAILPPMALVKNSLPDSFILYKPKDIVAGDFYWVEALSGSYKEGSVYFAAADCTGHGVPGAMVSVICSHALSKALIEENIKTPSKILDRTRELVIERFEKSEEEVKDGMDIALCNLQFSESSKPSESFLLQYAGANNPVWIITPRKTPSKSQTPTGSEEGNGPYLIELKADKQPIGKYAGETSFTNHEIQLQKGDTIYIFSDGFVDQFGGENLSAGKAGGKKFKAANFKRLLLSINKEPMQKQKVLIDEAFEKWRGNLEQVDDVCIIGVRV